VAVQAVEVMDSLVELEVEQPGRVMLVAQVLIIIRVGVVVQDLQVVLVVLVRILLEVETAGPGFHT
jgi:hypothetical protein